MSPSNCCGLSLSESLAGDTTCESALFGNLAQQGRRSALLHVGLRGCRAVPLQNVPELALRRPGKEHIELALPSPGGTGPTLFGLLLFLALLGLRVPVVHVDLLVRNSLSLCLYYITIFKQCQAGAEEPEHQPTLLESPQKMVK